MRRETEGASRLLSSFPLNSVELGWVVGSLRKLEKGIQADGTTGHLGSAVVFPEGFLFLVYLQPAMSADRKIKHYGRKGRI